MACDFVPIWHPHSKLNVKSFGIIFSNQTICLSLHLWVKPESLPKSWEKGGKNPRNK